MANLGALAPITTSITALSNLLLVSPQSTIGYQPQNTPTGNGSTPPTLPALLFHYEGEQTVALESDITDHYIENNSAIQDQIALRPEHITTQGFIGELNDIAPIAAGTFKALLTKLTVIGAYTPELTIAAITAYDEAFLLYQTAANAVNTAIAAYTSITGTGGESVVNGQGITTQRNQTKQQVMFQQFYQYWRNRTLFTVQTPWAVFQDCAIEKCRAIQDEKTNVITDFEVTFKLMRFASTLNDTAQAFRQTRLSNQASPISDNGVSTPSSDIGVATGLSANYPGLLVG